MKPNNESQVITPFVIWFYWYRSSC